jgi:hypothetical protein
MNSYLGAVPAYENQRNQLPYSHWLRGLGQTQHCCPAGQFRAEELLEPEVLKQLGYMTGPKSVFESKMKLTSLQSCEAESMEGKSF